MHPSSELGLLRLVAQGLVDAPDPTGPVEAVRRMLAVQAQDLPGALTSVALRTGGRDRAAVVAALDAGLLVRSWPMRGTLHLLAADDLPWLLPLAGPRMVARSAARQRELGLDARTLSRACHAAVAALSDGPLGRADLMAVWERAGIGTAGQRGYHLAVHLAQTGVVCLGPTAPERATEQLFVACDGWLPTTPPMEREQALAELAWRYLSSHGPATVADLARWSSLPVTEVRRGVDAVRDRLAAVQVDGVEHLMDPATPDRLAACHERARGLLLLPGFDEFLLGYADRDAVLAPEHAERIVPGRNGVFRPTVVLDGRVVATWRPVRGRRGVATTVSVDCFDEADATTAGAVERAYAAMP